MDSLLLELQLRDEHGNIRTNFLNEALNNVQFADLNSKMLGKNEEYGGFIFRKTKENKPIAQTSIQKFLDTSPEELHLLFGGNKTTLPMLKAYDKFLEAHPTLIDTYYQVYLSKHYIPLLSDFDGNGNLFDVLSEALQECFRLIDTRLVPEDQKEILNRVKLHFDGLTFEEISREYGETRENTRRLVRDNLFIDAINRKGYVYLNEHFYNIIENFKSQFLFNDLFTNILDEDINTTNFNSVKNKLDFLGLELVDIAGYDQSKRYFIVDGPITKYRPYINAFVQFMKKHSFPGQTLDELFQNFQPYYKDEKGFKIELIDDKILFENLMQSSFITITNQNNEEAEPLYTVHWPYYPSIDLKTAKILFDNEGIMSSDEIFDAYNSRCEEYSIKKLTSKGKLHLKKGQHIQNTQPNFWKFSEDSSNDNKKDARVIINEFLSSQKRVFSFDEVKEHLNSHELQYPDSTIRAYIQLYSNSTLEDKNSFVHKDFIDDADVEVSGNRNAQLGRELFPIIKNNLLKLEKDISKKDFVATVRRECENDGIVVKRTASFDYYLNALIEGGHLQIINGNIIQQSLNKSNIEDLQYRQEPNYREIIRNEAVSLLKDSVDQSMTAVELWDRLQTHFPQHVARTNFYKIFNNSNYFEPNNENGRTTYKLITQNLPNPVPSTTVVQAPTETDNSATVSAGYQDVSISWNYDALFKFIKNELARKFQGDQWDIEEGLSYFKSVYHNQDSTNAKDNLLLSSLIRVLTNYSDYFDRDTCLQRLSLSFESYLKSLLAEHYNNVKGLGTLIKIHPNLQKLYDLKKDPTASAGEKQISYALGSILYYRNQYAHDPENESLNISFGDHMKYIMDFVALYLFVPGYLKVVNIT